jgi:hypothetical protein
MEYSDTLPWAVSIQPVSNWAGRYDGEMGLQCVTYAGSGSGQIAIVVPAPGSEWKIDQPNTQPEGGASQHCMKADWPATGAWLNLNDKPTPFHPRNSWMGSLLAHGQDASGQYYRRNATTTRGRAASRRRIRSGWQAGSTCTGMRTETRLRMMIRSASALPTRSAFQRSWQRWGVQVCAL